MDEIVSKLVPCPPLGDHALKCEVGEDTLEDTQAVLDLIASHWSVIWPKLRSGAAKLFARWERPDYFQTLGFRMSIRKSGGWVDDDFFIELEFEDVDGFWCVFFKDFEVIHVQPSF